MAERRDRHLRLPAQRLRDRGHPRARAAGRARRRGHRQHLRRHRRGRAPGAPGDPPGAARAPRARGSSSPAAPPRSSPQRFAAHARGRPRARQRREAAGRSYAAASLADAGPRARARSTTSSRCARPPRTWSTGFEGKRARAYRAGAARLRSPLHLLHHPLWPRRRAARCRPARSSSRRARLVDAGYREIVLTGVDLTAYGADLPGRPTLGQMVAPAPGSGAGAAAAAALLARPDRDRRRRYGALSPTSRG